MSFKSKYYLKILFISHHKNVLHAYEKSYAVNTAQDNIGGLFWETDEAFK